MGSIFYLTPVFNLKCHKVDDTVNVTSHRSSLTRRRVTSGSMGAQFVKDETITDGTHVQPGTRFIKRWVMLNSGDQPWDSNTKVRTGTLCCR